MAAMWADFFYNIKSICGTQFFPDRYFSKVGAEDVDVFFQDSFDVSNLLCVSTSGFQSFKSLSRLGLLSRPTEN